MEEIIKIGKKEYTIVSYFEDEGEQYCVGRTLMGDGTTTSYKVIGCHKNGEPYLKD